MNRPEFVCNFPGHRGLGFQEEVQGDWTSLAVIPGPLSLLTEDKIYGNEAAPFVRTGNATAELVGTVIVPLCEWLGRSWLIENPASKQESSSLFVKRNLCLGRKWLNLFESCLKCKLCFKC